MNKIVYARNGARCSTWWGTFCLFLLAGLLAGCAGARQFSSDGLPKQQYYVGGGLSVNYKAASEGTAYVVEEKTRKILRMETVAAGREFEFEVDPTGDSVRDMEKVLGIPFSTGKFNVYFVPKKEAAK